MSEKWNWLIEQFQISNSLGMPSATLLLLLLLLLWLYSPLLGFGCFFTYLVLYTVGRTPWTSDQPVARPLPKHRDTVQTSMPRVRFGPTVPTFERAKTVNALDRAAGHCGTVMVT
jgi:hypothetical protein